MVVMVVVEPWMSRVVLLICLRPKRAGRKTRLLIGHVPTGRRFRRYPSAPNESL